MKVQTIRRLPSFPKKKSTFISVAIACAAGSLLLGSCQDPFNSEPDQAGGKGGPNELTVSLAVVAGTYTLQAVHSGKCVDVSAANTADGANIQQWSCNGSKAQQWSVKDLGGGAQELRAVHSGKCADVAAWSMSDGGNIHQWSCNGQNNQKWQLVNIGSGEFQIKSVHSGKCFDVAGAGKADGTNILQWACGSSGHKKFKLVPVGTSITPLRKSSLTWFESYPDPGSTECLEFNGCTWAGQFAALDGKQPESWVRANNIAAVHERDFAKYKLKTLRLTQGSRQIDVKVYDMCSDSDCNGCCTKNAAATGFLIDVEKYTAERFGTREGTVDWTCLDCTP